MLTYHRIGIMMYESIILMLSYIILTKRKLRNNLQSCHHHKWNLDIPYDMISSTSMRSN
jgi:hypothetical protein